ncbi:3-oxoacyl-[acyl-carrier-protein] synthase III C-terminal domain-containing protein [Pelagovum pacificum]|uniref:Ketoacyl-ACP synthase III n=1 Tax=Pelagovum pacificum TaxID=2588711 RepID=A0A5C5GC45_9RHOB|nr:3-oxoacyl-[acyl-carrier-protein] synthase III C-terminal domain-containing protein [Pelagovum pacificum]QQA42091.1 ketoacyl-ACP synthase III [Pelagovum pacificum]TNY31179.1 ketoacyl-ACP synthase III [Pelagovum pacificum]
MGIEVAGTGRALPRTVERSDDIDCRLGRSPGSMAAATGVTQRYVCRSESQVDLAVVAAEAALADAGVRASDIGLVLFGASVPYQSIPATAPLVMARLGMADGAAAGFDVNSTCLSFLSALDTAALWLSAGRADTALIVSAEVASRALPWDDDPEVAALFGDGAAAAILRRTDSTGGIRATLMRSYPSAYEACGLKAGGTRFDYHRDPGAFAANARFGMTGKELFRLSSRHFGGFVEELLSDAGWRLEDVDLVVPHQASPFALTHMARQVGVSPDRLVDIAALHGNQIAASIPFAFDVARTDGRAGVGSRVLMLGTSAGVSFGGMALEL